ncbi:F-box domain-containing protein [Apiospora aurea]|uniref:F-box domain-containing protein n=1 Tax=Apiospora aurea TaxID=335848 RepID=A0ABR1PSW7_9PEZI
MFSPSAKVIMLLSSRLLGSSQGAQSAVLLELPNELLLQIFAHAHPVCQLFLLLTCKRLLAVSSMKTITIPSAASHRSVPTLNCSAMLSILHIMRPLDSRRRPKKSWAPCWGRVEKRYRTGPPPRILEGYNSVVKSWTHKQSSSYQCPECWCRERIRKYGHLEDIETM